LKKVGRITDCENTLIDFLYDFHNN